MTDELDSSIERHWSYHVPPVSAIAALEAIVRLGSFAEAAAELNRTPSAVSHAIRDIERKAGVALFSRVGRKVSLTPVGKLYAQDMEAAIDALKRGTRTLQRQADEPAIRVSAPPLIVATLLIPHMAEFEAANPPFTLKINTANQAVNFAADEADVGVRFMQQDDAGLHSTPLAPVWSVPVCSPHYMRKHKIQGARDLRKADLIKVQQAPDSWQRYFEYLGVKPDKGQNVHTFDSTVSALEAARQGLGVVLGMFPLVGAYPGYGTQLLRVPADALEYPYSYRVVCRDFASQLPKIKVFRAWLAATFLSMTDRYAAGFGIRVRD